MLRIAATALLVFATAAPALAIDPVRPNTVRPDGASPSRQQQAPSGGSGTRSTPGGDCHRQVREHFLPEAGRSVRHAHRGADCRPVLANPRDLQPRFSSDCHRDVRSHRLPGSDGPVLHRHVGEDCRISIVNRSSGG